jgi:hypothetical protein
VETKTQSLLVHFWLIEFFCREKKVLNHYFTLKNRFTEVIRTTVSEKNHIKIGETWFQSILEIGRFGRKTEDLKKKKVKNNRCFSDFRFSCQNHRLHMKNSSLPDSSS